MQSSDRVRPPGDTELDGAWQVVRQHLEPTPVVPTRLRDGAWLKLETFQPTGSFKVRGALAALAALDPEQHAVTASAGNHGLGMAFAAGRMDRKATVVVAQDASPAKVSALRSFPVEVVEHGSGYDDAERRALELAAKGGEFVSAYNDVDVIAGQATIAREVREQLTGPLTLVCGVGGGGLCAGLSLAAGRTDDVEVIGVEAEASRAVSTAVAAGRVVHIDVGATLADGLEGNLDDPCVTPEIIARHTADVLAVSEVEIVEAIRWLFREHGLVVEGAAAVGVAAALAGKLHIPAGRTAVFVLTGRNIAPEKYAEVLAGRPQ